MRPSTLAVLIGCSLWLFGCVLGSKDVGYKICPKQRSEVVLHDLLNGNEPNGDQCKKNTYCLKEDDEQSPEYNKLSCACGMLIQFQPTTVYSEFMSLWSQKRTLSNASSVSTIRQLYSRSRSDRGEWFCSQIWGEPTIDQCIAGDNNATEDPTVYCVCSSAESKTEDTEKLCDFDNKFESKNEWNKVAPKILQNVRTQYYTECEPQNKNQEDCGDPNVKTFFKDPIAKTWNCFKDCEQQPANTSAAENLHMILDRRCCADSKCDATEKCPSMFNERTCAAQRTQDDEVHYGCLETFTNMTFDEFTSENKYCQTTEDSEICICENPTSNQTLNDPQCNLNLVPKAAPPTKPTTKITITSTTVQSTSSTEAETSETTVNPTKDAKNNETAAIGQENESSGDSTNLALMIVFLILFLIAVGALVVVLILGHKKIKGLQSELQEKKQEASKKSVQVEAQPEQKEEPGPRSATQHTGSLCTQSYTLSKNQEPKSETQVTMDPEKDAGNVKPAEVKKSGSSVKADEKTQE